MLFLLGSITVAGVEPGAELLGDSACFFAAGRAGTGFRVLAVSLGLLQGQTTANDL
jgi:hypothetical protein